MRWRTFGQATAFALLAVVLTAPAATAAVPAPEVLVLTADEEPQVPRIPPSTAETEADPALGFALWWLAGVAAMTGLGVAAARSARS